MGYDMVYWGCDRNYLKFRCPHALGKVNCPYGTLWCSSSNYGMVVKVNASGKVEPGYGGLLMVALEDELQGGGIDDTYAAGQPVQVWIPYRGDMFYAIPSGTTNPVAGDLVEAGSDSGGAGKVVKHTVGTSTGDVLGQVVQVVTTTVPGENNRVVVRVF